MTVLQQIKSYYQHLIPNQSIAKKLSDRLLTPDGVKPHPTPEDYFAERGQRLDDAPASPTKGRILSERA